MFRKKEPVAPKAPRTAADLRNEYTRLCTEIGDRTVKIELLKAEIIIAQARTRQLNDEFNALPKPTTPEAPASEQPTGPK